MHASCSMKWPKETRFNVLPWFRGVQISLFTFWRLLNYSNCLLNYRGKLLNLTHLLSLQFWTSLQLVRTEPAELGRSVHACLYKQGHGPMRLWAFLLSIHLLVAVLMLLEKHRMIFTCKDAEALRIFEYMQKTKTKADKLTFVGFLTACGNTVLLDTGQACFTSFVHDCL